MNDATPPPLPKKRFELPKSLLIIWFILFALTIYLGVSTNLDSGALGELSGRFVGITLISLLLSWVAWRLSRRSDWVKATVFLIAFLLFSVDLLAGLAHRRRVARAAPITQIQDQARRIQEDQFEEFKKTGAVRPPNSKATDQMIATMKDAGARGDDQTSKVMTAFADFLQKTKDGEAKHTKASEKTDSTWIIQPKTAKSIQEINAISAAVTNFMQVNQDFLAHFTNCAVTLAEDLKSKGVLPTQIQDAIRGLETSLRPQLPYLKKIRQQDHEYGRTLLQILELYKTEQGKWKWDAQKEVAAFGDKSSGERWLELIGNVNEIAQEQQKTQAELINLRAKNRSRSPR